MKRGDVYYATLDPTVGHEQRGTRPVVIFQNDTLNAAGTTALVIPLTTNLRRAALPSCHLIRAGDGGLREDSVALCHQIRAVDSSRLATRIGGLAPQTIQAIDQVVKWVLGP